jgi:hypothetical protein
MYGDKVLVSMKNMQNIHKRKGMGRGGQNRSTNMSNIYTFPICCTNLVIAIVLLMKGQLL